MKCDVRATGLYSFRLPGCPSLGTGIRHDVFQRNGSLPICRLMLKILWGGLTQLGMESLSSLGHPPSGQAACPWSSLPSSVLALSVVRDRGGGPPCGGDYVATVMGMSKCGGAEGKTGRSSHLGGWRRKLGGIQAGEAAAEVMRD